MSSLIWYDDLIWCPSQCFATAHSDVVPYTLYLRWRHTDPWQGYFIKNVLAQEMFFGRKNGSDLPLKMSCDIFSMKGVEFSREDPLDGIKAMLEFAWFHKPDGFEEIYFKEV